MKILSILLLILFCFNFNSKAQTTSGNTSLDTDFSKPVVLLAPLDLSRIKEIALMLSSEPMGLGEPCNNRRIGID